MDIIELGKTPISSENPSGEDARFEPEYEDLQGEIEKLSSPTSQGATDWNKVISLSTTILAEKSKNLLVAGYLSVGLLTTRGLEGLPPAMGMFRGIIENFWKNMYPPVKRMRGRTNALEWWNNRLFDIIQAFPDDVTVPKEIKSGVLEDLDAIDAFLGENMKEAPLLHRLRGAIDAVPTPPEPQAEPPPVADQATPPHEQPAPAAPAPPPPAAPKAPETSQDARQAVQQSLDDLYKTATYFRKENPGNPLAYRFTRLAAWLQVDNMPPATDGKTLIPPPGNEFINALKNLYQQQNYRDLLEAAESRVNQYIFWLDLSRYVSESLDELRYDQARAVVNEETARYFSRLPGIGKLAFSDGTPFADEYTLDWLKEISAPAGDGSAGPASPVGGDAESAESADLQAQAQALFKEKKLVEALDLLQTGIMQAGSQRSRFLRRLGLAALLVKAKKPGLAIPHFLETLADIDAYQLETWNPDLAVQALKQTYEGLKKQKDKALEEQLNKTYERIARLNPAVAVQLDM